MLVETCETPFQDRFQPRKELVFGLTPECAEALKCFPACDLDDIRFIEAGPIPLAHVSSGDQTQQWSILGYQLLARLPVRAGCLLQLVVEIHVLCHFLWLTVSRVTVRNRGDSDQITQNAQKPRCVFPLYLQSTSEAS